MDQTLYEIVDDFRGIMKLLDDVTNPDGAPCLHCNPERWDRTRFNLYISTLNEDEQEELEGAGRLFALLAWLSPGQRKRR